MSAVSVFRAGIHSASTIILGLLLLLFILLPLPADAGSFVAFEQSYLREKGNPVTITNNFMVLNPNTDYILRIHNGGLEDAEFENVSSSVISLNGIQVVGPNEFNQNVSLVEKPVTLAANNELAVIVRGKPGGGMVLQIIGVDDNSPSITASVDPSPNAAGWHSSDVTVSFDCTDDISGVASCSIPVIVQAEGDNQVITGTAVDQAGNTATTSVTVRIDKTAPTISSFSNPAPNVNGWNNTEVNISFAANDSLSGIDTVTDPITLINEARDSLSSGFPNDGFLAYADIAFLYHCAS